MTNGDRIRQMTDEELAEWLADGNEPCDMCAMEKCDLFSHCKTGVLKWLKQEANESADNG